MLNDFRKLFRQSLIYGLGTLSTKLVGFVLIPLYTHNFPLSQFGVLGLLEVCAQVVISVFGFALYSGFFRWYWDKNAVDKRGSLFFTITVFQVGIAVLTYVSALPFLGVLSEKIIGSPEYGNLLRLMLLSSLFQLVLVMPNTLLRLQEKPWLFTLANTLQFVFSLSVTVYFIVFRKAGIEGVYYGQIAGSLAYTAVLLRFALRNMVAKFELKLLKEIIVFCFPLFLSGMALVILNVTDRFFINHLGQLSDVGLYSYGFKLANTLNVFLVTSVSFAIQPMIYSMMDAPGNKRFYAKLLTYYTFGTLVFGLALMVFGMEIAKIFAKRADYFDAWHIFPFIVFSIVFGMMKDVAVTGMNIAKKTAWIAATVVVTAIINLVFNGLLIPVWGNQGAALSKLLAMMAFFALTLYASQKQYPIPYEMKRISIMLVTAAILYCISLLFNGLHVSLRLGAKTAIILAFPFMLYLLGFYEVDELQIIRNFYKKWRNPVNFKSNIRLLVQKH